MKTSQILKAFALTLAVLASSTVGGNVIPASSAILQTFEYDGDPPDEPSIPNHIMQLNGGRIGSMGAGVLPTDGINLSQLTSEAARLDGRIDFLDTKVDEEVNRLDNGIARIDTDLVRIDGRVDAEQSERIDEINRLDQLLESEQAAREGEILRLDQRVDGETAARTAATAFLTEIIEGEITERSSHIRKVEPGAAGSTQDVYEEIHIGPNSLVTFEDASAGVQVLTAQDSAGNIIPIDVRTGLNVDGNLTVNNIAVATRDDLTPVNTRIDGVESRVNTLENRVGSLESNVRRNTRGIAMVAAMTSPTLRAGMNNAFDLNVAHFHDQTAMSASYARRINENLQVSVSGATDESARDAVIRGGFGLQW